MSLLDNLGAAKLPVPIVSGEGALLWDAHGTTYWDFYGGHAVTLIGLGDPRWVDAIATQGKRLSFFTTLADIPVRTRAAESLCRFVDMDRVFFVNSGAEANEAALKLARKATGRSVVIAMEHGFHGRTMGAVGASWKYRDQHAPAHGDVRFVPFGDLEALDRVLDDQVAAVITEPVQGMAGVVMPPRGWLAEVQRRCHAAGALLIADEVQSGMGRMGVPLAAHLSGVRPDIVTLGKGLGGGFPVAAMLCTEALAQTVKPGEHGTTFGGAPMACAAVEATLDILAEDDLLAKAAELGRVMHGTLKVPGVREVRGAGAWCGLVLDRPAKPVQNALREAGFLVGTASQPDVLRLAPAAVMPAAAVHQLADTLSHVLTESLVGAA